MNSPLGTTHPSMLEIFVMILILVIETNIHINFFSSFSSLCLESKVLSRLLIIMAGYLTKSRQQIEILFEKKKYIYVVGKSLSKVHTILLYQYSTRSFQIQIKVVFEVVNFSKQTYVYLLFLLLYSKNPIKKFV